MGQKVNPHSFRIGQGKTWSSVWFARDKKDYSHYLLEDFKLRRYLRKKLVFAGLDKVEIRRSAKKVNLLLHVSRPGVVIGRGGSSLEVLKKDLCELVSIKEPQKNLQIDVVEVRNPDLSAYLIAQRLSEQLIRRMPHRRVITKMIERVMASGAQGVKIVLSGRIAGAEISRVEKYGQGKVPLQTIRSDIDYSQLPALTKSGYIGIKVWIYKGEN